MRKIIILFLLAFLSLGSQASSFLFRNGVTNYDIVLNKESSESEKTAANEISTYLNQISGAHFRILTQPINKRKYIYVGYDNFVGSVLNTSRPNDEDESFRLVTRNGNLYIYGGKMRGTMYGVYKFLEDKLGVRWYTYNYTKVPKYKQFVLQSIDERQNPAFKYRCLLYYACQVNKEWDAHNMLNSTLGSATVNKYGGIQGYFGVHTMKDMIPVNEFYDRHPEYFALRNNKRVNNGQLCLSNPDVIKLLKQRTLKLIKENPGNWCYSVSQNDNQLFCECKKCKAIEKRFGGHSGLLLWVINQVADEVHKYYPQVYIGTLAYQYTQSAPKNIKPRDNVVIRLTDIQCCLGHSFESGENREFLRDLQDWFNLTPNVFIWDYATSFLHYMMPFPNFHALNENLRLLNKFRAIGIMEEGQYDSYGGAFNEMKQWCFSKLLWNPNLDIDSLSYVFIKDYYGKASGEIQEYYDLCNELNKSHHLMAGIGTESDYFSESFISLSRKILDSAQKKVQNDSVLSLRVMAVRAQILYLQYKRSPLKSRLNGTTDELKSFFERTKWNYKEGKGYDQLVNELDYG